MRALGATRAPPSIPVRDGLARWHLGPAIQPVTHLGGFRSSWRSARRCDRPTRARVTIAHLMPSQSTSALQPGAHAPLNTMELVRNSSLPVIVKDARAIRAVLTDPSLLTPTSRNRPRECQWREDPADS
jgi:hypothetical protein